LLFNNIIMSSNSIESKPLVVSLNIYGWLIDFLNITPFSYR